MKKNKINQLCVGTLILAFIALLFSACKKTDTEEDNRIPESLENVRVENIPGGAIISYDPLTGRGAALVTAVYPTEDGATETLRFELEEHSSEIILKGLTTEARTVELFTVNNSGNKSVSIEIEIEPLVTLSHLYLNTVLESVDFNPIPSGISFSFENPAEESLSFILFAKDENDEWIEHEVFQSEKISQVFLIDDFFVSEVRLQLESIEDLEKSNNRTFQVSYMLEKPLDKLMWKNGKLPGDNWEALYGTSANYSIEALWDGNIDPSSTPRFENRPAEFPQSFTIDLGENQSLKISKLKIHHFARSTKEAYTDSHPKVMEVWGSNDPDVDGGWESWTKIGECVATKPSGNGPVTPQDLLHAQEGESYNFPVGTVAYRYLRFKVIETWTGVSPSSIRFREFTLWGVE